MTARDDHWFDELHGVQSVLAHYANDLSLLGDALAQVGNETLANRIFRISERLAAAEETIGRAVSDKIHDDFAHSQHMAFGLLGGIVNGVIRAPEPQP